MKRKNIYRCEKGNWNKANYRQSNKVCSQTNVMLHKGNIDIGAGGCSEGDKFFIFLVWFCINCSTVCLNLLYFMFLLSFFYFFKLLNMFCIFRLHICKIQQNSICLNKTVLFKIRCRGITKMIISFSFCQAFYFSKRVGFFLSLKCNYLHFSFKIHKTLICLIHNMNNAY